MKDCQTAGGRQYVVEYPVNSPIALGMIIFSNDAGKMKNLRRSDFKKRLAGPVSMLLHISESHCFLGWWEQFESLIISWQHLSLSMFCKVLALPWKSGKATIHKSITKSTTFIITYTLDVSPWIYLVFIWVKTPNLRPAYPSSKERNLNRSRPHLMRVKNSKVICRPARYIVGRKRWTERFQQA